MFRQNSGGSLRPTAPLLSACAIAGVLVVGTSGAEGSHCANPHPNRGAMERSFHCNVTLKRGMRPAVLMIAGTFGSPASFEWNYLPALADLDVPVCTVNLPGNATVPIQESADYIAFAIHTAYRLTGHRVNIIGHSQGGMSPRWVFRFAPETRHMVKDMISLAASNHGADIAHQFCDLAPYPDANGIVGCPPAMWQQRPNSEFLAALNEVYETVPEISYTSIYSTTDEVIGPARPSLSALRDRGTNVANIAVQDLCPADGALHFDVGSFDPVAFAIVVDALEHPGPARRGRMLQGAQPGSLPICGATFMPGVNPATFEEDYANALGGVGNAIQRAQNVSREPQLPCYAGSLRRAP